MKTNSPNPVDGDVQALIHRLDILAGRLKWHNIGCAQDVLKAVDILTTPPAQLLRPVVHNSSKPGELAERARTIMDDCNSLIRRINATEQPVNDGLYRIANHIAGAKNSLPQEWQDWAEEIESDLRKLAAAPGAQDS